MRSLNFYASPFHPDWTRRSAVAQFLDLRPLTNAITQVVELGSTHVAAGIELDLLDVRGVHGKGALHAYAVAELADGERLAKARTLALDDVALENLGAFLVTFDDADVHLQVVAGAEGGDVVPQAGFVDEVCCVHGTSSWHMWPRWPQMV